ncbi:DUF371 domain-containing protein [Candidatus Bathyarchaeota archaeon]|nr:DUF371 domain-containing protein [Candidatus Bathyarchaeota archaeon]
MMPLRETFTAWGHPNIRSTHRTTLMTTTDDHLSTKGDCIIAVRAEKGLRDLGSRIKEAIRREGSTVRFLIETEGKTFKVEGFGDPRLTLSHPSEMVIRKSGYICDRTLMIRADKAACDIDFSMIELLRKENCQISLTIEASL